jgi:hypothetical protein
MQPVSSSQLFHDVLDVNLDRFLGDKENLCDIVISVSTGYVAQNVDLSCGRSSFGPLADARGSEALPESGTTGETACPTTEGSAAWELAAKDQNLQSR